MGLNWDYARDYVRDAETGRWHFTKESVLVSGGRYAVNVPCPDSNARELPELPFVVPDDVSRDVPGNLVARELLKRRLNQKREGPKLLCDCHDCTQARDLMRAGGIIEHLRILRDEMQQRLNLLGTDLERIEAVTKETRQRQMDYFASGMSETRCSLGALSNKLDRVLILLASLERRTSPTSLVRPKRKRR